MPSYKIHIFYTTTFLLILVLLTPKTHCTNQCQKNYQINRCSISINTCSTFQQIFLQCTQTFCKDGIHPCNQPQIVKLNQTECLLQCCDQNFTTMSRSQLDRCLQTNVQYDPTTIFVFVLVLVVVVLASSLPFLLEERCKKPFDNYLIFICRWLNRYCTRFFPSNLPNQSTYQNYEQQQPRDQQKQSKQLTVLESTQNQRMMCQICYGIRTNVVAKCGDYFHFQCVTEWFYNKKHSCPTCKSSKIARIKTYCNRCFVNFIQVDMIQYQSKQKLVEELMELKCSECRPNLSTRE